MLHQQHLQDSEQWFYSRHRCCLREEKGEEEKERAEEEEDQAAKKYGDETSPQVACENTWKRSSRFVFGKGSLKQTLSAKLLGTIKLLPRFYIKALEYLIKMDVVDDVKQTETYLTTLRARKMANNNSANSPDSSENNSSTEEAS